MIVGAEIHGAEVLESRALGREVFNGVFVTGANSVDSPATCPGASIGAGARSHQFLGHEEENQITKPCGEETRRQPTPKTPKVREPTRPKSRRIGPLMK